MKDEELFKAWKSEQYKDQSTEEKMEFVEHLHTFPKYFEKTFLAGLKAGRPQWHKPEELPPKEKNAPNTSIYVLDQYGQKVFYSFFYKVWKSESDFETKVTHWCEIPTFDKE